jgi:hypothetical protein
MSKQQLKKRQRQKWRETYFVSFIFDLEQRFFVHILASRFEVGSIFRTLSGTHTFIIQNTITKLIPVKEHQNFKKKQMSVDPKNERDRMERERARERAREREAYLEEENGR